MKPTFTERQRNLIRHLLQGPATTEKLAQLLGVNRRTVLRELPLLSKNLEVLGIKLVRRAGAGLRIDGEKQTLLNLEQEIENVASPGRLTPEERRHVILLSLLEQKQPVKLYVFADRFNVTEATISYDLDKIEEELRDYDIKLVRKPGYGVKLEGRENDVRRLLLDLFYKTFEEEQLLKILKDNAAGKDMLKEGVLSTVEKGFGEYIARFIDSRTVAQIEKVLDETLRKWDFLLADSSYAGLLVHIALAMERLKAKETITMDRGLLTNLKRTLEFKLAGEIARALKDNFDISIPDDEKGYIAMHLLGAKLRLNAQADEFFMINHREAVEAARRILILAGEKLKADLMKDKKILEGLAVHLKPAISRLKLGMEIRNPLISQLKKDYSEIMRVAQESAGVLEDIFQVKVPESEIGYIAMHLGAAMEKKAATSGARVLLVCASGIGSARMLASRVNKELPELEVQDVVSLGEINRALDKYPYTEALLSTVPLELENMPVFVVSPLLAARDVARIKEFLKSRGAANSDKNLLPAKPLKYPAGDMAEIKSSAAIPVIFELLEDFMLVQDLEAKDAEGFISEIVRQIDGRVEIVSPENIKEDLLERQITAGCGVPGKNLAVFHARSRGAKKPFLGIFRLKKGIEMENMDRKAEEVDTALVMLLPYDPPYGAREIMGLISAAIIQDPDVAAIFRKASGENIIKVLLKIFKERETGA